MKGIIQTKHKEYLSKLLELEKNHNKTELAYGIKRKNLEKEFSEYLYISSVKKDLYSEISCQIRLKKKKSDKLYSILDKRFKILSWFIYLSAFLFIIYTYFQSFFDNFFHTIKIIIKFDCYTMDIYYFLSLLSIIIIKLLILFVFIKLIEKLIPFMDSLFFIYFYKTMKKLSHFIFRFKSYTSMEYCFKFMRLILNHSYIIRISYFLMLFLLIIIVKRK